MIMRLIPNKSIGEFTHIWCLYFQPEGWRVSMTNREPPKGNLAVLLCALSFATGLGLGERMEHGLHSAYLRLLSLVGFLETEEAPKKGGIEPDFGCLDRTYYRRDPRRIIVLSHPDPISHSIKTGA